MKSLKEIRLERGFKLNDIVALTGLSRQHLSLIELGKVSPSSTNRKRFELILKEKINWLEVPKLSHIDALDPAQSWDATEREFRFLLKMINSLPEDEKDEFIKSSIKHLRKL